MNRPYLKFAGEGDFKQCDIMLEELEKKTRGF